ncbi:hypothetical protein PU088_002077 [Citrobacter farmeri]|nr:hypothetical protein [Citrobacter farmeri]
MRCDIENIELTERVRFCEPWADRLHADAMDEHAGFHGEHEHLFHAASEDEMA